MDWISNYRIGDNWFDTNDKKMIYNLIKNHESEEERIIHLRDHKISEITNTTVSDPLFYLNDYLDVLYGKIYNTLSSPNCEVLMPDGLKRLVSSATFAYDDLIGFSDNINQNTGSLICPYKIEVGKNHPSGKSVIYRGAFIKGSNS